MDDAQIDTKELIRVGSKEDLDVLVSQLSSEEKAELIQKLLGQSGLMMVLGGSNVTTSEIVIQIHSNSGIDISEILKAIATKITQPKFSKEQAEGNSHS